MNKTFKVAQVRGLLNQVNNEQITFSRFVEILNEAQYSLKIKQLGWVEDCGCVMAETPFLKYLVLIIGGKVGLRFDGNDEFLKFRTVDEAKAAAQADFCSRVLSCLL